MRVEYHAALQDLYSQTIVLLSVCKTWRMSECKTERSCCDLTSLENANSRLLVGSHRSTSLRPAPLIFTAKRTVLPPKRPELCGAALAHAPGLWPVSSQYRTLRQPHLLGSGGSFTHASSARIFSMEEDVRGIGYRMACHCQQPCCPVC